MMALNDNVKVSKEVGQVKGTYMRVLAIQLASAALRTEAGYAMGD